MAEECAVSWLYGRTYTCGKNSPLSQAEIAWLEIRSVDLVSRIRWLQLRGNSFEILHYTTQDRTRTARLELVRLLRTWLRRIPLISQYETTTLTFCFHGGKRGTSDRALFGPLRSRKKTVVWTFRLTIRDLPSPRTLQAQIRLSF